MKLYSPTFIQGRIKIDQESLIDLAYHLRVMNECCRRGFSLSLRQNLRPSEVTRAWVQTSGCLVPYSSVNPLGLTTTQHNSIARKISFQKSNLIAVQEENLSTIANKIVVVNEKISKERLSLAKTKRKIIAASASSQTATLTIKKKQFWINKLNERRQRLMSKHEKLISMIKTGKHSMVFGGAALLRQRENIGVKSSKHKDVAQWRSEWNKRDCGWIFEGDKSNNFANSEVQWHEDTQMLRIRLTNEAHREKVEVLARRHGLSTEEYQKCRKHDLERNRCRFLFIPLSFNGKGQARKLALFRDALTPIGHPSKQGTVIYHEPIKWEIWIDGDKAYARAAWISVPKPQHSWLSNGSLGVDINAWGVSWSACCPSGNKLMTHEKWFGDIPVAWRQSRNQSLHAIREAAKKIVDLALARGVPLALENLNFAQKRDSLRYGNSKFSKMLSSFAYMALREAIQARAQKSGVDVLLVRACSECFFDNETTFPAAGSREPRRMAARPPPSWQTPAALQSGFGFSTGRRGLWT